MQDPVLTPNGANALRFEATGISEFILTLAISLVLLAVAGRIFAAAWPWKSRLMAKLTPLQKAAAIAAIIGTPSAIFFGVANLSKSQTESTGVQSGNTITSGRDTVINNSTVLTDQQPSIVSDDSIYQAGIIVGKAFGARRLTNDATRFEFREITNCAQLNTSAPFTYSGVKMLFEKEQNSAMMVVGRNDNPIRFGVTARVLAQ
jgi:hypothetical protein